MHKLASTLVGVLVAVLVPSAKGDYLPGAFRAWSGERDVSTSVRLGEAAGQHAPVLQEFGVLWVEQRTYTRDKSTITARLYGMRDASAAFGAYTHLLNDHMVPADLSRFASVSRERVLAVLGDRVLEIAGDVDMTSPSDLRALVARLKPSRGQFLYPEIGGYFPERGRIRNSERYMIGPRALNVFLPIAPGDWIGFNSGAEAQLARYRVLGKELVMLLVVYPTPQLAAQKQLDFARWIYQNVSPASNRTYGPVAMRRKGSLLALVLATAPSAEATELLDKIRYETQVTWNEPNHTLKDPTLGEMIVGTLVGTGIFLLLALAAGMGFGGVRLLVKKVLPGKVFDRTDRLELIQLGLSSKPIEAKDFYK